ncbi:hypothetical protein DAPPUDRAFT_265793 [Daphnia pulex]|uniref:Uncharacterized protein n=1 Tax=Daphnia pulex TaxID=6669 RepID=E9HU01_DAPPU|nr:hypothetical protein DAPPUDRAFT_265793 [Daphnia pulex]|eukprot:EFX64781.1 hypothetical protein DAPPUDRAFT_265793 [Daphnia pulex]
MKLLRSRESSMDVDYWMASFLKEMELVECAYWTSFVDPRRLRLPILSDGIHRRFH